MEFKSYYQIYFNIYANVIDNSKFKWLKITPETNLQVLCTAFIEKKSFLQCCVRILKKSDVLNLFLVA